MMYSARVCITADKLMCEHELSRVMRVIPQEAASTCFGGRKKLKKENQVKFDDE